MESDERKLHEFGTRKSEISSIQDLDKAEIIKKCLDYKSMLDKAEKQNDVYRSLLIKLSEQYELLKAKIPDINEADYNKDWNWVNKIVFVLKKINRPLLSSEIIAFITPYEPVLKHSRYKAQAFSANLTKAVKYGRVRAYKLLGSRGYYYVLSNWLDSDGQLNKNYEDKIFFK